MKAEGFELHIYCDRKGCKRHGEYFGKNRTEARRAARVDGWKIATTGRWKDFCSTHKQSDSEESKL